MVQIIQIFKFPFCEIREICGWGWIKAIFGIAELFSLTVTLTLVYTTLWLGSSCLSPTGWIVVIPLAERSSVIRALTGVGKTTTSYVVVFF